MKSKMQVFLQTLTVLGLFTSIIAQAGHEPTDNEFMWGTFPEGFMWGSATSSYQIEGAWNVQGKGANIWDSFTHQGGKVANNDTGDDACLSYYKYRDDVKILKDMGSHFYRFSISWARLMTDGTKNTINQPGIDYYNNLINALLAEGIIPMVTMFHWDLPQHLQDFGGWENDTLIQYFNDYADLCYKEFGDRVKYWMTFNEPLISTWLGYGIGVFAPGKNDPGNGQYITGHVIIRAHAQAWHLYDNQYRARQKGKVGIVLNSDYCEPLNPDDPLDVEAARRDLQFGLGWYAHPIFKNGDYPDVMKEYIGNKSLAEGLTQSRLPVFTAQEKLRNQGTSDFFGLNHYTTHYSSHEPQPIQPPSYDTDKDVKSSRDPSWPDSGSDWLKVVPWGIRKLLQFIKEEYNNPVTYVTENRVSDQSGSLQDDTRVYYYKHYINNVLKARVRDGVNVQGYTAWSLMDNFEWASGYDEKFGMHYVDFKDPARPRTPKESARYFASLIANNGFVEESSCASTIAAPLSLAFLFVIIQMMY